MCVCLCMCVGVCVCVYINVCILQLYVCAFLCSVRIPKKGKESVTIVVVCSIDCVYIWFMKHQQYIQYIYSIYITCIVISY